MRLSVRNSREGNPYFSRGFTLVELIVLFLIGALTIVGAVILRNYFGGRFGWLLGGLAGFLAIPMVVGVWALFICLARDGIPMLPSCQNGRCRGSDYELRRFDEEFYWVCKCGDRYTRRGRLFLLVTDKEETTLCRTWRPFRGWFPSEQD